VSTVAAPGLPRDHCGPYGLLGSIIGGTHSRAMQEGEQMGLFMAKVLRQSAIGRQAKCAGEQSVRGAFQPTCSHVEPVQ